MKNNIGGDEHQHRRMNTKITKEIEIDIDIQVSFVLKHGFITRNKQETKRKETPTKLKRNLWLGRNDQIPSFRNNNNKNCK